MNLVLNVWKSSLNRDLFNQKTSENYALIFSIDKISSSTTLSHFKKMNTLKFSRDLENRYRKKKKTRFENFIWKTGKKIFCVTVDSDNQHNPTGFRFYENVVKKKVNIFFLQLPYENYTL